LSGRGLCDELITRPEESYRLCCVVVCDLETSRMGAPYVYDISTLRVNENYVVPCICLRAIWHMHGSMWRATRMTRDGKRIIVAHCVIALWHHYYYALAKYYCRCRVGHFSGYPSHKTYTCQFTLKQLRHVLVQSRRLQGAYYSCLIKLPYSRTVRHTHTNKDTFAIYAATSPLI